MTQLSAMILETSPQSMVMSKAGKVDDVGEYERLWRGMPYYDPVSLMHSARDPSWLECPLMRLFTP